MSLERSFKGCRPLVISRLTRQLQLELLSVEFDPKVTADTFKLQRIDDGSDNGRPFERMQVRV